MGKRFVCWWAVLCVLGLAGAAMGDLVGHWKLDEGTSAILDSSGNGNDGTIVGNPTPIAGVVGNALEFHGLGAAGGGGDYINCGSVRVWISPGRFPSPCGSDRERTIRRAEAPKRRRWPRH